MANNGGSPILSYELQVDDGAGGDFTSLTGYEEDSTETSFTLLTLPHNNEPLSSGGVYRFRFRVRNTNGWSLFSPISHVRAATIPERPPAPAFVTATADSITVYVFETPKDGGSVITEYELYINSGGLDSTDYTKVTTYDGFSATHTLTTSADSQLSAGTLYKLKTRARNSYGVSIWSEELNAGVSSFPAKPN